MKIKSVLIEFARRFGLAPIVGWTLAIASIAGWTLHQHQQETLADALNEARNYFKLNQHYRAWNAKMGGVYAPVEKVAPNPHLNVPEREITTTGGSRLTLVNPAYMTRMVFEEAMTGSKTPVITKLTSLNALNPGNAPDPWERRALTEFQRGRREDVSEVISLNRLPYVRLLSPFVTEQSCLKCHGTQGYKLGDIRGGISISVPLIPYLRSEQKTTQNLAAGYFLLWMGGCGGIAVYSRRRFSHEKSLAESESKFRTLVETAQEGIWQIDRQGRTVLVNRRMAEMLQYSEGEMMNRPLCDFVAEEWRDTALGFFDFRSRGISDQRELLFLRRDGSELWAIVSATPQFSERREYTSAVAFVNDITDRKRAETKLAAQEKELRTILSHLPDVVARFDRSFRHIYISPAITKATGLLPEQFVGRTKWEMGMREDLVASWHALIEETFTTGREGHTDFSFAAPEGERYYEARIIPEKSAEGTVVSVLVIARDLTEKQLAEEALRSSEEKYRSLFTTMQEGFALHEIICNDAGQPVDYRFLDVNPAFEKLTGIDRSTVIGMTAREVFPNLEQSWIECYGRVATTGVSEHLEHFSSHIGRYFDVTAYSPRPGRFAVIFYDVTEERRLQEEIIKAQKLESIGVLAGGIAHDFNNILTGIVGNISLALVMVGEGHVAAQRLRECEKATWRAAEITRQLLTFSRGGEPEKTPVDTGKLLREAVTFSLYGSKCRCTFDIQNDIWPLNADAGQIHQAVSNLVINAVQAMPEGGLISIAATNAPVDGKDGSMLVPGRYVRISIRDQGCGILHENLKKIFDPYFTTKANGTGLGLTSAYSIIKRHGGVLRVESSAESGTAFEMLIPAVPDAVQDVSARSTEVRRVPHDKPVLVMDDEEMIRSVAEAMLSELGYSPVTCADGEEAVRLYAEYLQTPRPFAAVILDMTIPGGMGGRAAAEKIREIDPDALLFISSGYATDSVLDEAGFNLFDGAIKKPYDVKKFAGAFGV